MQIVTTSHCGVYNPRVLVSFILCGTGVLLAMLSVAANPAAGTASVSGSSPSDFFFGAKHGSLVTDNASALAASAPLAPTQEPGWSIITSPNLNMGKLYNLLEATTCVSASDCWAVGWYQSGSYAIQTLVQHWDGNSWALVTSPNSPNNSGATFLKGVSCVSASDCWAVGYYNNSSYIPQTLTEHWDGTSWSIVTSPNASATEPNVLYAVTCASTSDCWAVGTVGQFFSGSVEQTLIEHWDGSSWSIVTSPNTSSADGNFLFGITCTSASNCWAVGHYWNHDGSGTFALIEHWNGIVWSIVKTPVTGHHPIDEINAVACTSAVDCWAVGEYTGTNGYDTLMMHWNGRKWTIVSSPNASTETDNYLYSVTCASASNCWAVGSFDYYQPLIERWDGTSWTVSTGADVGPGQSDLRDVVCSSATDCLAVGYYSPYQWPNQTLIEKWTGTSWEIASSANYNTDLRANALYDVTCISASDCWAVGYYNVDSTTPNISYAARTLIQHWNGSSWTIVSSPNLEMQDDFLTGVACTSGSDCWAVGSNYSQQLIAHWDGNSWTIVTSPNNGLLNDVTCASATDCWAVGSYNSVNGYSQTLIEHWDGISWATVASPNTSPFQANVLQAVTCVSGSECWAVGYTGGYSDTNQTIIEHWDGSSWTIVTSPNTSSTQSNHLKAVACSSVSDCWAIGYFDAGGVIQTLIERWDGSSWSIITSPNVGSGNNYLDAVTCASAANCWAIGYYLNNGYAAQTLTEHWDGTSWATVLSPNNTASQHNYLYGVICPTASNCWAVGEHTNGFFDSQTLIEAYSPTIPALTGAGSRKIHGSTAFDIDLLSAPLGIECRSPGATGTPGVDHKIIFTFVNDVGSCGTASIGSLSSGPNLNQCTVDLTGVANQQSVTIALDSVLDSQNNSGNVSATMGLLLGDTNADGTVNSADITQVRRQSGNVAHGDPNANFREDTTTDGTINSADITQVRRQSGTALP